MLAIVDARRPRRGARHLRAVGGAAPRSSARVTGDGGRLRILDGCDGEVLADVPGVVAARGRAALRPAPRRPPTGRDEAAATPARSPPTPDDCGADLLGMLADTVVGVVASTTTSCSSTPS